MRYGYHCQQVNATAVHPHKANEATRSLFTIVPHYPSRSEKLRAKPQLPTIQEHFKCTFAHQKPGISCLMEHFLQATETK